MPKFIRRTDTTYVTTSAASPFVFTSSTGGVFGGNLTNTNSGNSEIEINDGTNAASGSVSNITNDSDGIVTQFTFTTTDTLTGNLATGSYTISYQAEITQAALGDIESTTAGLGNIARSYLGQNLIFGFEPPSDLRLRDHTGDFITDTSDEQITVV